MFRSVDEDTVVFVLGDHGMTEDGNHGGATTEETGAALLIWSRSAERLFGTGFRHPPNPHGDVPEEAKGRDNDKERRRGLGAFGVKEGVFGDKGEGIGDAGDSIATPSSGRQVAQIDLVPTVALLMGVPVPFGNLGGVIPEVFRGPYAFGDGGGIDNGDPRFYERLCDALLVNSVQVQYCVIYFIHGHDAECGLFPIYFVFSPNELDTWGQEISPLSTVTADWLALPTVTADWSAHPCFFSDCCDFKPLMYCVAVDLRVGLTTMPVLCPAC